MEFYYQKYCELIYHFSEKFVNDIPEVQYYCIHGKFNQVYENLLIDLLRDFFVSFEDFGYSLTEIVRFFTKASEAFLHCVKPRAHFTELYCNYMNSLFQSFFSLHL